MSQIYNSLLDNFRECSLPEGLREAAYLCIGRAGHVRLTATPPPTRPPAPRPVWRRSESSERCQSVRLLGRCVLPTYCPKSHTFMRRAYIVCSLERFSQRMHLLRAVARVPEEAAGVLGRDGPERPVRGLEELRASSPSPSSRSALSSRTPPLWGRGPASAAAGARRWRPAPRRTRSPRRPYAPRGRP